MRRREGVSMIEALVALLTGLLVVQLGLVVLVRQRDAQGRLSRRAQGLAAARIVRDIIAGELRRGRPGRDWKIPSGDSLVLRAFRGEGGICPERPSATAILVAYEGVRAPDPDKDSVLLMDGLGHWSAWPLDVVGTTADSCPAAPGVPVQRWSLGREPPAGVVLARVFERGSYHLVGRALRYRRGAGGRQPLTPEVLLTPRSRFFEDSSGVDAVLVVRARPGGSERRWREALWRRAEDVPR